MNNVNFTENSYRLNSKEFSRKLLLSHGDFQQREFNKNLIHVLSRLIKGNSKPIILNLGL